MGWKGESRRHSLARRGIRTASGMPTPEERAKAWEETQAMIKEAQDREDAYYEYLYEMMEKTDLERIAFLEDYPLEKIPELENVIEMGKQIQDHDIYHYENNIFLKKLSYEEYKELNNLYASAPLKIKPIHVEMAKKGWISLYDGDFEAVVPSHRGYNPNVVADLRNDYTSYVWETRDDYRYRMTGDIE